MTPARLPEDVDVLVVGAGQAGLGAAHELSQDPGLRILVLDRDPVGQTRLNSSILDGVAENARDLAGSVIADLRPSPCRR